MHTLVRKILNRLTSIYEIDTFLILEAPLNKKDTNPDVVINKITSFEDIEKTYINLGRNHSKLNLQINSRLHHHLEFYTYSLSNEVIATCWILNNISRFIDEIAINVKQDTNSQWIRDIYVHEAFRGKNIFSYFISLIITNYYPDSSKIIFSDIKESNKKSFRAHNKYGFKTTLRIKYITLFGRVLLRAPLPKEVISITFQGDNLILLKNSKFKNYVTKNIA